MCAWRVVKGEREKRETKQGEDKIRLVSPVLEPQMDPYYVYASDPSFRGERNLTPRVWRHAWWFVDEVEKVERDVWMWRMKKKKGL